jgi:hypothetical protein
MSQIRFTIFKSVSYLILLNMTSEKTLVPL